MEGFCPDDGEQKQEKQQLMAHGATASGGLPV
jgi:hypothetical protein